MTRAIATFGLALMVLVVTMRLPDGLYLTAMFLILMALRFAP